MNALLILGFFGALMLFAWVLREMKEKKKVLGVFTMAVALWTILVGGLIYPLGRMNTQMEFWSGAKRDMGYALEKIEEQLWSEEKEKALKKLNYLNENWKQSWMFNGKENDDYFIHWKDILETFNQIDNGSNPEVINRAKPR